MSGFKRAGNVASLGLFAVVTLCLFTGDAWAIGPGLGLGGKSKLHPYFDLEGRYNSNVNNLAENENSDFILTIHPGLDLSVPTSYLNFQLTGRFGYSRYFGIEDAKLKRNVVTGDAGLDLTINPNGAFQLQISDRFQRTEEPRDYVVSYLAGRYYNIAKALLVVQPGGGALRVSAGYGYMLSYFDSDSGLQSASSLSHNVYFDSRWRFLPKTSFLIHFDMAFLDYPESGSGFKNVGGMPLNAWLGLSGLLTRTLAFNMHIGYGDMLLDKGDGFRSAIATLEVLQRFSSGTSISGGYIRDFSPAHLFKYYGEDRVFIKVAQALFDNKLNMSLKAVYAYVSFGSAVTDTTSGTSLGSRYDSRVRVSASVRYDVLQFLALDLEYLLTMNMTGFEWQDATTNTKIPAEYNNHQVWLSVIFHY